MSRSRSQNSSSKHGTKKRPRAIAFRRRVGVASRVAAGFAFAELLQHKMPKKKMKLVYENLEKNLYYAVRMLRFMKPFRYSKYSYKILFKGLHPLFALCNRKRGRGGCYGWRQTKTSQKWATVGVASVCWTFQCEENSKAKSRKIFNRTNLINPQPMCKYMSVFQYVCGQPRPLPTTAPFFSADELPTSVAGSRKLSKTK